METTAPSSALAAVIHIQYLDDTNAVFHEENGFISLTATVTTETEGETKTEEKHWDRVFLHSAFPFDMPEQYLSVLDKDQVEIGMVRDITQVSPEMQIILRNELQRKYYAPRITSILSVKERYGFSYWKVQLKGIGEYSFTVQDTYRSMLKVDAHHVFVIDVDGNRYEILDVEALDHASYKKIELYL